MKETPILMSTESVKAILEGRKTQTRRMIKPQPIETSEDSLTIVLKHTGISNADAESLKELLPPYCHYGQVGDRLWVRETYLVNTLGQPVYRTAHSDNHSLYYYAKWELSRFMPRWASRITLEITEIRVERLQEITNEDAVLEGIFWAKNNPRDGFSFLWDSLNAKRGYGWETNPWVWVISFERVK